jgi:hypothetical protein
MMVDIQLAVEGHARGNPVAGIITNPAVESAALDLGAAYERVALVVTATEAANMAALSSLRIIVDDEEWSGPDGALVELPIPAAGEGIYFVADVGWIRTLKIGTDTTPAVSVAFTVYGINRVTKATSEQLYQRTL